jgi:two-component system response regulator HydG
LFVQADGGTLFLDEIGEMPPGMQVKLLRALEERSVRPVGGERVVPINVRFVAATNRDLEAAIEAGRFRSDLYYRINVIPIEMPALRSRGTDVLLLAQHFIEHFARAMNKPVKGMQPPVAQRLLAYNWPGNVRELRNVIERGIALTQYDQLTLDDLPEKIVRFDKARVLFGGDDPKELVSLEEVQRRYISHVLDATGGNQTQAARILGVDRKTLYRKRKD